MRFASRTDFGNGVTEYGTALEQARASGSFIDLTVSNPTRCGFHYPSGALLSAMNDPAVLRYEANPLGMASARETLSGFYRRTYGTDVSPERLLLTASTSEAYGYLLRLFCEPGDAILVPSPSYPLFDLLAQLHDVEVITYPLVYHDGWQIDPFALPAVVTPRTRAIVVIHPNNPTGHYCSAADRNALYALARQYDLPLIVDEVFLDYAVEVHTSFSFTQTQTDSENTRTDDIHELGTETRPSLTFVLGGLSKTLALPQMKLAWMAVCGPEREADAAMARLEVIADTFLSVSAPPQVALSQWLREREGLQAQITARIRANLNHLDVTIAGTPVSRLKVEGGWSAVLRIPANGRDMDVAVSLLTRYGLAVHPGSFYGFAERGWLVISLLTPASAFQTGLARLLHTFA